MIKAILDWLLDVVGSVGTLLIIIVLAFDSVRAVVAYTGFFNTNGRLGRIIYGNYKGMIVQEALNEMGINSIKTEDIKKNNEKLFKDSNKYNGITDENAVEQLIRLLAKYIVEFDGIIEYGGRKKSNSKYYLDTMEISHSINGESFNDADCLAAIMCHLINSKMKDKKPEIIFVPKGGNPLFAEKVAANFGAQLVAVKDEQDKSKIVSAGPAIKKVDRFRTNFEGSWPILNYKENHTSIVLDCNASGGTQLVEVVKNVNKSILECDLKIDSPEMVFVLFLVDVENKNVDKKFEDCDCKLIRYFDLDEEIKHEISDLNKKCIKKNNKFDCYDSETKKDIDKIIEKIKNNKKYYYKVDIK